MRRILLLTSACLALLASAPRAGETAAGVPVSTEIAAPAQAAPTPAALAAAQIERLQRAELNARMEAVLESSRKTIAGLQKLIDATTDATTVRALEARMAEVKQGTTLDLLRVQSKFARENGRIAQADAIDAEVDAILNPKRVAPAGGAR